MTNTNFLTDGTLGAKLDRTSTSPEFAPGTVAIGNGGKSWIYVGPLTGGSVSAAGTCTVTVSTGAVTNTAGNWTSPNAMSAGDYGWVYKTTSPF